MVQEGTNAPGAMARAEITVLHVLEQEEKDAVIAMVKVVKDVLHVVEREETYGVTLVAQVVMVVDIKNVMTVMEVVQKSVVCAGDVAITIAYLVMVVVMMIVMNVMDMENCVWNVTDAMAMAN